MSEDLPAGWASAPIGSLCTLINGRAFKPTDWKPDGLPIIRIQNLNNPDAPFNRYPGEVDARHLVSPGELLFAWSGTPGTSFGAHVWKGGSAVLNQHIFRVLYRPDLVDRDYFRLAINWRLDELIAKAHGGAGLAHITKGRFEETEIVLPPLAEQRRIVARIEALFARTRRARADLERVAPLAARYRAASVEDVLIAAQEEGWPARTLDEVAVEIRNGISAKPHAEPPGTPMLRISAVRPGRVALSDTRYHRADQPGADEPYRLRERDLLFVRFNGNPDLVAACGMVRGLDGRCVYPDKLIRVRLHAAEALPEYVEALAASPAARRQLSAHIKTAAGQHGISGADLRRLSLPFPDLATQRQVAEDVAARRARSESATRQSARALALLERLEQSILAKAFRGELVPQDPSDEPAEALLARLGAGAAQPARPRRGRPAAMPAAIARITPPASGSTAPPPPAPAPAASPPRAPATDTTAAPRPEPDEAEIACAIRALFADAIARPRDQAMRDLARALGHQRLGARIEERMHGALIMAVRRRILENTPDGLRLLTRAIGDYTREELQTQFLASLQGRAWTEQDAAIQGFTRWLGFQRTGPVIVETAESTIRTLIRQGRLERDGKNIRRCG